MISTETRSAIIVDPDRKQGLRGKVFLEKLGFEVDYLDTHLKAFEELSKQSYDIALIEMVGGTACDFELLQYITRHFIRTAIIAMVSANNSNIGVRAIESGARGILFKPYSEGDLDQYVKWALESQKHAEEAARITRQRQIDRQERRIIGSSPSMRSVLDLISSLSDSPFSTVLIKGESGTGKDLIAQAIHDATFGDKGPFSAVSCAAIPAELLESELFGHEKGAFTGATQTKRGIVELTDGGTLYLDEIAELPPWLQPKLLGFLDDKLFRRVGGSADIKVSLKIIASTNKSIEQLIESGAFRRDLYFRLSGFPLIIPPLRERGSDVVDIARYFVDKISRKYGKKISGLTPGLEDLLQKYHWPGNVSELRSVIERAVIISNDPLLDTKHFYFGSVEPEKISNDSGGGGTQIHFPLERTFGEEVAAYENDLIVAALQEAKGVKINAARLLGLSRHAFDRVIKRHEKLSDRKTASNLRESRASNCSNSERVKDTDLD